MRSIMALAVAWFAGTAVLGAASLGATSAPMINMLEKVECLDIKVMLGAGLETKGAPRDFKRLFDSDRDRSQEFKNLLRDELTQRLAKSGIDVAEEQEVVLLVGIWGRSTGQIGSELIYTYLIEISVADDRGCGPSEEELDRPCLGSETRKTVGSAVDRALEGRLITESIELLEEGWLDWRKQGLD